MSAARRIKEGPILHTIPTYHLKAPYGWLNDPCAPGYDIVTGTYHLFYQWNPTSCDWGNICWGHFTSRDGVTWDHNGSEPVISPDQPYDDKGAFTGCLYPSGLRGEKGQLSIFYSSVTALPIHWTLPYSRNCEGLAVATSTDGGRSWVKSDANPILDGEPDSLLVTGFRDPFLTSWPALDVMTGIRNLYGVMSGGVLDQGPAVFLYAVSPNNLCQWKYQGQLISLPNHFRAPGQWAPDFGINWECVNFLTLRNGSHEGHFLTFGSEGGFSKDHPDDETGAQCVWLSGSLENTADGPRMIYDYGGILDHGNFYAPNSYEHPITKQKVVWGWLKEEELPLSQREFKGWTGHLSLPRELFLISMDDVVGGLNTAVEEIHSVKVVEQKVGGRKKIQTLGVRPLDSLRSLRRTKARIWSQIRPMGNFGELTRTRHTNWELEAVINVSPNDGNVGFCIRHSQDLSHKTAVIFSPTSEEISVDRSQSNAEQDIKKDSVSGPFTLFVTDDGESEVVEKLRLRIFCDGSILEIFANDRFALSTVVYSDLQRCNGVSWFADAADENVVVFESIKLWENLRGEVNSIL